MLCAVFYPVGPEESTEGREKTEWLRTGDMPSAPAGPAGHNARAGRAHRNARWRDSRRDTSLIPAQTIFVSCVPCRRTLSGQGAGLLTFVGLSLGTSSGLRTARL